VTHVLVLTKGHPFDGPAFAAMWDALADDGITWEHVEHPEGRSRLHPERLGADVLALYDMPGIRFTRPGVAFDEPPAEVVEGFTALVDAGVPILALHHAIAGWPAWPAYADWLGGRFHYAAATLAGVEWPDSGYRHDVRQTLTVVAPDHPVCVGLPRSFVLTDETYQCPVLEAGLTPLLVSDAPRGSDEHYSAHLAIEGRLHDREGWSHPPGSSYAAWVKAAGRSTLVYVQPGDGPPVYGDPNYRRLLANAVGWLATTRP
jgi:type 1 glutamine amidotransferase